MSLLDDLFGASPEQATQPQVVHMVQTPPEPVAPEPEGLDKFQDLWKMPEGYKPPEQFDPSKLHEMKPEDFQAAVAKMDFTQGIDPTQLQAIAAGGEEAVKALAGILRQTSQNLYANSTLTTTKLIENALSKAAPSIDSKIAHSLRGHEVSRALTEENPLFSNPATAAILEPLKAQLIAKYPDATPKQLAGMAKEYLASMAGVVAPQSNSQTTLGAGDGGKPETNWETYFSEPVRRG